jgi:hypothetical protein
MEKQYGRGCRNDMRTISLEEHFVTSGFLDGPGKDLKEKALNFGDRAAHLIEQLSDIGDKRIAEMDAAGIDMQILSLTSPGLEQLEAAPATAWLCCINQGWEGHIGIGAVG